jgi:hypothetical protein
MKMSKRLMLPMAAIAMLGAAGLGAATVSAASSGQTGTLAQKLASAFNLDASKVQSVIDQDRSDHAAQHQAKYEERLTQAVKDGKLTEAQKQAILDENKKLKTEMDAAKDKTGAERKTALDNIRTEATDWAKAQNLDAKWLMAGGPHPRGGMGHGDGGTPPEGAPAQ